MAGPATLTERIIHDHLVAGTDEELALRVDQILLEDATGTMACLQFERLGLDRVAVPTVSYVDHNILQFDNKNPEDHAYLRSLPRATACATRDPATASRTTCTSSASRGPARC